MKIGTFFYSVKQGLKNIVQNRMFSLASIGTITACLFLFGIFYFLSSNFKHTVKNLESSVSITVFFEEGISEEQIQQIGTDIRACKDVRTIEYISAEKAWEKFKEENFKDNEDLAVTFQNDNPLQNSASYNVYLTKISGQKEIVNYIKQLDGVRQVNSSATAADSLNSFNMLIGYVSGAIIIILLGVAIFLISTTVSMGVAVRRKEISIMKLVGATDFFVKTPFIVEGIVIGLIGAVIPLGLLYIIYDSVVKYVTTRFTILNEWMVFIDIQKEFQVLTPLALIVGVGIGFFGSMLTVQKQIKKIEA